MKKVFIVAMRGRTPEDNSDRKFEQKLEINYTGLCNTITSAAKDNMVLEYEEDISPIVYNDPEMHYDGIPLFAIYAVK